jgi:hypothetical protein
MEQANDLIKTLKALEIVHLNETLGEINNVWIRDKDGNHFQETKNRNEEGKVFSAEGVDSMMDTLENEMVFIIPDNERD